MFRKANYLPVILLLFLLTVVVAYFTLDRRQHLSGKTDGAADPVSPGISESRSQPPDSSMAHPSSSSLKIHESNEPVTVAQQDHVDVSGSVSDEFDNPVPFARLQLNSISAGIRFTTQSGADGSFLLKQVQPADDYHLIVESAPRYIPFDSYDLTLGNQGENLDITLEYTTRTSLQCIIQDQLGNAVPALELLAVSEEWSGYTAGISSDQSGMFSLSNFVPGRMTLLSRSVPNIMIVGLVLSPGELTSCELVVDIGSQQLFGMVTGNDGVPIQGVDIRMRFVQRHDDGYRSMTTRSVTTNAAGGFHFSGLGSGVRELSFSAPGFKGYEAELDPSLYPGPHSIALSSSTSPTAH